MRSRLLLIAVAVTVAQGHARPALASWNVGGGGTSGASAAVLAAPTGLTVTGQSCTPTYSGATTIAYRDSSIATGAGTVTVSRPTNTVAGDLLVAAYTIRDDVAGEITAPTTGWTQVRLDIYASKNLQTGIWYHTAAAGDPASWTWTSSVTTVNAIGAIAAYSGASGVDTSSVGKQPATPSVLAPSVTASVAGARLVGVFTDNSNVTMSTPAGMTTRRQSTTTGSLVTLGVTDEALYTAGATGDRTAVLSNKADSIGQLVALTPAVAPTASTISYVADNEAFGTTSFTIASPAGIQVGDLMVIAYGKRKSAPSVTTPTGWTLLSRDAYNTTDYQQLLFWRVATAADTVGTTYTLASSTADKADAIVIAYRGVDQTNPIVTEGGQANAADDILTAPSLTPSRADTRLVGFFGSAVGGAVLTTAGGMTSREYVASGTGGADVDLEVEDQPWAPSGTATGTRAITLAAGGKGLAQMVALKAESYPLAALTWTASTSTYADGYRLGRSVGGTETTSALLTPRTLTSYTVGSTNHLTAGVVYDMALKTKAANWLSTAVTASFTAMTGC